MVIPRIDGLRVRAAILFMLSGLCGFVVVLSIRSWQAQGDGKNGGSAGEPVNMGADSIDGESTRESKDSSSQSVFLTQFPGGQRPQSIDDLYELASLPDMSGTIPMLRLRLALEGATKDELSRWLAEKRSGTRGTDLASVHRGELVRQALGCSKRRGNFLRIFRKF